MSKTAFIICSRVDSERLPNKVFRKINGVPLIEHLISRLQKTSIPIYISAPLIQKEKYEYLGSFNNVYLHFSNHYSDPLSRMHECASLNGIDTIIRVTHDKILIDDREVLSALDTFKRKNLDYLFGSKFIQGAGFEIISMDSLARAASEFKEIEHISYAIRAITKNKFDYCPKIQSNYRFLLDFPEDMKMFDLLFSQLGNDATLKDCVKYLDSIPYPMTLINKQPLITIYTCAYNSQDYLEKCMESVARQSLFSECEYILIDDFSRDKTTELIARFCIGKPNTRWIRNDKNLGLSSSSNVALKNARGKYIVRLDADDFFIGRSALNDLFDEIEETKNEVIYPNNYKGGYVEIQNGKECHHIGGAIFDIRAINHLKFTEGLRNHDSLDVFLRAKNNLKIGYLNKPIFFYTQRKNSMSKTNIKEREKVKKSLIKKQKLPEVSP